MSIPPEKLAEIRDRTSLVQVVERSVRLTKRGRNYTGLCPFHAEKTPSFSVSEDKQLYYCFGCGASGDVFSYLMETEALSFVEAVKWLAKQAGVSLPELEPSPAQRAQLSRRARYAELNLRASKRYQDALMHQAEAMAYLKDTRGLRAEIIEQFELGWAPPGWTFLSSQLAREPEALKIAVELGLLAERPSDHSHYDRLRARVVFPIRGIGGDIQGFGGRRADWVDPEGPKYLNSPESPFYQKSSILYGLGPQKNAIRRERSAILVEGYLDVIALAQAGFPNAVAGCGTALTAEHAQLLKRYTPEVITLYDADRAGREATEKAALLLLKAGLEVRVAVLPDGEDPDSYVRSQGSEALKARLEAAPSAIDFVLHQNRSDRPGSEVSQAIHAAERMKPLLEAIPDPLSREVAMSRAAAQLGIDLRTMRRHFAVRSPKKSLETRENRTRIRQKPLPAVETTLLCLMLNRPEEVLHRLKHELGRVEPMAKEDIGCLFGAPLVRLAIETMSDRVEAQAMANPEADPVPMQVPELLTELAARGFEDFALDGLRRVLMDDLSHNHEVDACVARLSDDYVQRRLDELKQQVKRAQGDVEKRQVFGDIQRMVGLLNRSPN